MNKMSIDINADIGESYGRLKAGNDDVLFPYLSSCNIACGFHGGDPLHIETTLRKAIDQGLRIGAHPSYPDLSGFGRRKMQVAKEELKAIIKYQVAALKGMAESLGGTLAYVKPHGALYNTAASSEQESLAIIQALREMDPALQLMGLAGSLCEEIAKDQQVAFIAEAFADRRYEADGSLMARSKTGAVLHHPVEVVEHVLSIVLHNELICADGSKRSIDAQSLCIHGDNPAAEKILQALDQAFSEKGILKSA